MEALPCFLRDDLIPHPAHSGSDGRVCLGIKHDDEVSSVRYRFKKDDRIRVFDKDGRLVCVGRALHTRRFTGASEFQVWSDTGWAYTFNLNFVKVELEN